MKTKINTCFAAITLLALFMTTSLQAQTGGLQHTGPRVMTLPGVQTNDMLTWSNVGLVPVPALLRQHLPGLEQQQGMLVAQVRLPSVSHFDVGDILISIDGIDVMGADSLPDRYDPFRQPAVVIRQGSVRSFTTPQQHRGFPFGNAAAWGRMAPSQGVSVSAFAGGNESVSVSQSGGQYSIDMSLPQIQAGKIQFQGTRDAILQELGRSNLPAAAQQRVRDAIR